MNESPYRIAIAGIGGIGGYLGGKLACHYQHSTSVQVSFICRGEHAEAIRERGLILWSEGKMLRCVPHEIVFDPAALAPVDLLILGTKTFDSHALLRACSHAISSETVVLTTQNAVEFKETLTAFIPTEATIFEGAMYIAASKVEPGVVRHLSGPAQYYFGANGERSKRGDAIEKILSEAGIKVGYSEKIDSVLWKKFLFLSPAAVVTALKGISIPEILQTVESKDLYTSLFSELRQIAEKKDVDLHGLTLQTQLEILERFAEGVKTSFQSDLEGKGKSEVSTLVDYVLKAAVDLGISVPHYTQALKSLHMQYPQILKI